MDANERTFVQLAAHLASAVLTGDRPAFTGGNDIPDDLVRLHNLGPLAYRCGLARFKNDFVQAGIAAEVRAAELHRVADALASSGIRAAPIKGAAYLGRIYNDPAERPMSDIDLLVPPREHISAQRVLRELGYDQLDRSIERSNLHHEVTFRRGLIAIDLHRSLTQPFRSAIDLPGIWSRAQKTANGLWDLDIVDLATFHFAHAAIHELLVPMLAYIEGPRLLAAAGGVHHVRERARSFRLERGVRCALLVQQALTSQSAVRWPRVQAALLPKLSAIIHAEHPHRSLQLLRKTAMLDGPAQVAGLAAIALYQRVLPLSGSIDDHIAKIIWR